ncbi:MAG: hypothetical protein KJ718_05475 [Nanoarchaeota archaeon]|nr:hypothetical protein [Nanoarchaeota archaeon]MBU1051973.1 hypothetical protein [Nanoarchaeota archaeon]MBU1988656.1 hypothetical protein [Nanoarchaeota archaeon]
MPPTKKIKKNPDIDLKVRNLDKLCKDDGGKNSCGSKSRWGGCGGGFYGLGFLGAAIYYISTASGFWVGVLGILKAIIWPAFLVFELLKFLGV